jgi:hypothetical protein
LFFYYPLKQAIGVFQIVPVGGDTNRGKGRRVRCPHRTQYLFFIARFNRGILILFF